MKNPDYDACIKACIECATVCDSCATACLNEENVNIMTRCIELDRECSIACFAAAQLMAVAGENASAFCNACADICEACADECVKHEMEHCQRCAAVCRDCAAICRQMTEAHV